MTRASVTVAPRPLGRAVWGTWGDRDFPIILRRLGVPFQTHRPSALLLPGAGRTAWRESATERSVHEVAHSRGPLATASSHSRQSSPECVIAGVRRMAPAGGDSATHIEEPRGA